MTWFKILLIIWFCLEVIEQVILSSGWQPKTKTKSYNYAIGAVIRCLFVVGIFAWVL